MGVANCLDSAYGLDASASSLGIDVQAVLRTDFFGYNFHCYDRIDGLVYDCCGDMNESVVAWRYDDYIAAGQPGTNSVETMLTYDLH